jgi:hypothetical protein
MCFSIDFAIILIRIHPLTFVDLTICQSFIRCFLAVKKVEQMKLDVLEAEAKEKRIMEEKMATKISSAWRCFRWQILYKRIIKGKHAHAM